MSGGNYGSVHGSLLRQFGQCDHGGHHRGDDGGGLEATQGETTAEAVTEAAKKHGPIFSDLEKDGKLKVGIIGNSPTFCFHMLEDGRMC